MIDTKTCIDCAGDKSIEAFARKTSAKDGRQSRCRACTAIRDAKRYADPTHRARKLASAARYAQGNPERVKANALWTRYRLRTEDYDALLASQDGHCAICPATEDLVVDHNHECCQGWKSCGECVRGILCSDCNHMIGKAHDTPSRLRDAATYLETHA